MTEVIKHCDCCGEPQDEETLFDTLTLSIGERVKVWQLCRGCAATFDMQVKDKFKFPRGKRDPETLGPQLVAS